MIDVLLDLHACFGVAMVTQMVVVVVVVVVVSEMATRLEVASGDGHGSDVEVGDGCQEAAKDASVDGCSAGVASDKHP